MLSHIVCKPDKEYAPKYNELIYSRHVKKEKQRLNSQVYISSFFAFCCLENGTYKRGVAFSTFNPLSWTIIKITTEKVL